LAREEPQVLPEVQAKAGFSRRHDGLRDRIYREAARAGLLAHRENAPAVMRGLTIIDPGLGRE
jgi:hypothetical protein